MPASRQQVQELRGLTGVGGLAQNAATDGHRGIGTKYDIVGTGLYRGQFQRRYPFAVNARKFCVFRC